MGDGGRRETSPAFSVTTVGLMVGLRGGCSLVRLIDALRDWAPEAPFNKMTTAASVGCPRQLQKLQYCMCLWLSRKEVARKGWRFPGGRAELRARPSLQTPEDWLTHGSRPLAQ